MFLLDVGVAVAFRKQQLPILDDGDRCSGDVVLLQLERNKSVEECLDVRCRQRVDGRWAHSRGLHVRRRRRNDWFLRTNRRRTQEEKDEGRSPVVSHQVCASVNGVMSRAVMSAARRGRSATTMCSCAAWA